MGQVALGFRSLLVRCVVFFIMATLLSLVLGGNLWRSPMIDTLPAVSVGESRFCWRVRLDAALPYPLSFTLATADPVLPVEAVPEVMREVLPLKATRDRVIAAGYAPESASWILFEVSPAGAVLDRFVSDDRLIFLEEWQRRVKDSA